MRRNTAANTDMEALQEITEKIVDAKISLTAAKRKLNDKKEVVDLATIEYEKWKERFPNRTKESLDCHAKAILQPAVVYYNKLFHEEGGNVITLDKCLNRYNYSIQYF